MQISAGKLWSMRRLADDAGFFRMTAVDQRPGVEALVRKRRGVETAPYEDVGQAKRVLIETLSPHSTAMLLDPGYAFPYAAQQLDPKRGLLLTYEQWDFEESAGGRKTFAYRDWSVEKIKRAGADGVKLMLWWRPDASAEVNAHQRALVEQVGADCRRHDIAFLLEPLLYPLGGESNGGRYEEDAAKRPEMVIDTAREFRDERYGIDIFKMESPIAANAVPDPDGPDSPACQRWFDELGATLDRPWVMLSAGAGMEPFRRIVAHAFRAGASGYLAGRAIWWQIFESSFPDWEAMRAGIESDGVAYVRKLESLLAQHGTPWTQCRAFADGLSMADAGPDFFSRYPAR
ncbi:MAG: tagatose 1,6-diphosphate aldolase [Comamonadaceae bacterium]|nr:MAG: tagatose 1,6-diphosphate aldolase [Comamonadaceae bacterium]